MSNGRASGNNPRSFGPCLLVTVCLDCFDRVQDGLSLVKDFIFLEGQFSAPRIRLFAWAKVCGFKSDSG
jgi:hypothetical protein